MKAYIIFLSSGESIDGLMEDGEAERMKEAYEDMASSPGVHRFRDKEGVILLDPKDIVALVIYDPRKATRPVGFKTRDADGNEKSTPGNEAGNGGDSNVTGVTEK
jgi:hypothetical protein